MQKQNSSGVYIAFNPAGATTNDEGDWIGELLRDKNFLFYGATSKLAPVGTVRSSWFPWSSTIWRFFDGTTQVEKADLETGYRVSRRAEDQQMVRH